jgi:hypothetical protein
MVYVCECVCGKQDEGVIEEYERKNVYENVGHGGENVKERPHVIYSD